MSTPSVPAPIAARRRLSAFFYRRRWLKLLALLVPPLGWMVIVYLAALAVLLATSLWQQDVLSGKIIHTFTWSNLQIVRHDPSIHTVTRETVQMAVLVTLTDMVLAFPLAYYMVRVASRRVRALLFVGVLMPLWSSYLIKAYTWRLMTGDDGTINWALAKIHLGPLHIAFSTTAMWLAFSYIWLPYMVLPTYAALERIPSSLIEASGDLGGRAWRTLRSVILPLALPGIAAGSIFTFSLTLGDYIMVDLVGGNKTDFIGSIIFRYQGVANDLPLAAAIALIPVVVITLYLLVVKRLGAFEAL
ncbi:MAG: putative spermidine/putrescine transport system permease protein [Gaiellales bacterium]|jgi:putative spermidine/putrescine transport system permease protein|nr:putative spermidine/putrescine transport system permease protein [Gaiellales bacterium]